MLRQNSLFESFIGDTTILFMLLDGVFNEWPGDFNILLSDSNEYLPMPQRKRVVDIFFETLHSKPAGHELIFKDDLLYAAKAAHDKKPIVYFDDFGLRNVAVPVFKDELWLATIFFGHLSPAKEEKYKRFLTRIEELEVHLDYGRGQLTRIAKKLPKEVSDTLLQKRLDRVLQLIEFFPSLGSNDLKLRAELQKELQRFTKTNSDQRVKNRKLLQISQVLQSAIRVLGETGTTWEDFWRKANTILEQITDILNATCCAFLLSTSETGQQEKFCIVKASSFPALLGIKSDTYTALNETNAPKQIPFLPTFGYLKDCFSSLNQGLACEIDLVSVIEVNKDNLVVGLMTAFSISNQVERDSTFTEDEQTNILEQVGIVISNAACNLILYKAHQRENTEMNSWLDNITHQILGPMNSVQADAWLIKNRLGKLLQLHTFSDTDQMQVDKITKSADALISTTNFANDIAQNLRWSISDDARKGTIIHLEKCTNIAGLLIEVARDYQSLGQRQQHIRITVISEQFTRLNNRLCIDDKHLRQALGNIIHNAVKYSTSGSEVIISGGQIGKWGIIRIINNGIQLYPEEVEKVFEYKYRGREATHTNAPGTGIGLPVAREIVVLHGGTLTVEPSKKLADSSEWQTTFTIKLPIGSSC